MVTVLVENGLVLESKVGRGDPAAQAIILFASKVVSIVVKHPFSNCIEVCPRGSATIFVKRLEASMVSVLVRNGLIVAIEVGQGSEFVGLIVFVDSFVRTAIMVNGNDLAVSNSEVG